MVFDKNCIFTGSIILLNIVLGCWNFGWGSIIQFALAGFLLTLEIYRQKSIRRRDELRRQIGVTDDVFERAMQAMRAGLPPREILNIINGIVNDIDPPVNWMRDGF